MGLDVVEIVMEVEERFGIYMPDDAAEEIGTVGGLHTYVLRQLNRKPADTCLSSSLFYRIRRGLIQIAGVPRSQITPDADLRNLVRPTDRRRVWKDFEGSTEIALPMLKSPVWARYLVVVTDLAIIAVLIYLKIAWFAVLITGLVWLLVSVLVLTPFYSEVPPEKATIRQVIDGMLPKPEAAPSGDWTDEAAWQEIQRIVSTKLQIKPERVTPTSTWPELGAA